MMTSELVEFWELRDSALGTGIVGVVVGREGLLEEFGGQTQVALWSVVDV